jgi:predicted dehydrogenase
MQALRVGQVGLGWFGSIHRSAWAQVPGVEIVGLCDTDEKALYGAAGPRAQDAFHELTGETDAPGADEAAEADQAPVLRTTDLGDLLAAGIDLLDVVVTESAHAECARAALESGVDVVVEKPLALTSREVRELYDLAAARGRHIYVGHVLRFDPRYIALQQERRGGALRHLSLERHFQPSALDVYGRVHPVVAAAVHDIDVAVWCADRRPSTVTAYGAHFSGRQHPDDLTAVLRWDDGVTAVIQNSWHLAPANPFGFTFSTSVYTTQQTFVIRNEPDLWVWGPDRASSPDLFFWPQLAGARRGALVDELAYFARCARAGLPSQRPSAEHVRIVAEISDAVIASLAADSAAVHL